MSTLFYLESSPSKDRSHSVAVARAFIDAYSASHRDDTVETMDVWETDFLDLDAATLGSLMSGKSGNAEGADILKAIHTLADRFKSGDKYVFSIPMWNFSIPYRLKHFIDLITQSGVTFAYSEKGLEGLVTGRPAVVIYASGFDYSENSPFAAFDLQKAYFELWLRFIGFTDIHQIVVAPTAGEAETVATARETAIKEAQRIAAAF